MEQHALVVPFPAQSHMNALFNFASVLSSRGFIITFVNTEHMHHRIFPSSEDVDAATQRLRNQGLRFRFDFVADGLPTDHSRGWEHVLPVLQSWAPVLEDFVSKAEKKGPPFTCIVADAFVSTSTHKLSLKLQLPRVDRLCFFSGEAGDAIIACLPGIPPVLRPADLILSHVLEEVREVLVCESDFQKKGDWAVVNSFEELEGAEAARGLSENCRALYVGPVSSVTPYTLAEMNLWKEDRGCLRWLDKYPAASVLYVSFGSLAVLSVAQLLEVALGLEASGHPFLWAMRPDVAQGYSAFLPPGFDERTRDRSLVVEWSPQREVLAHRSVGGFLTHNGWNSTLESISSGVPMFGWPIFGDQFVNCRLMKDAWRVGLSFGDRPEGEVVRREEVEKLVRCLMDGEQGKVLKQNVKRLQRMAISAVVPGGSSSKNIDTLAGQIHNTTTKRRSLT